MSLLKRASSQGAAVSPDAVKRSRAGEVYASAVDAHFASSSPNKASPLQAAFRRAASVAAEAESSPPADKAAGSTVASPKRGARTVEQIYQKKTQLEHILLRPDSYVGSVERQSAEHWIYDDEAGKMVRQKLDYVPALYKIFDEILVNAADNLVRSPKQDAIHVEIDAKNGWISVWNNGSGLPVQVHKEHGCYVPELVFGQLLTSDNYDDDERKVTGGRNGYGAKLTNIFSKKFILETADSASGKCYKQVWENNMTKRHDPEIKSSTDDFTRVTFFPDLPKFGMTTLEKDIVTLMRRRAYDVAAATHGKCEVHLNQKQLTVKSFEDFVALHLEKDAFRVCQVINDRWEVAIALNPEGSGFQQVSFVNSISTSRGGTHVNVVADQLINPIMDKMVKSKGGLAVKPQHVRGYLFVFVNCLIENPAFDSQTKETLTSKKERFGSTCQLPEALINNVLESGILQALQEWSKALGQSELAQFLNRSDTGQQKRLFGIPKLEDANRAGTKEGGNCTLILTEGDSAKALAVAGLSVIGRDLYGVFPLRGKLRNVRDLTVKQMLENREIDQVMRIMALDAGKVYDSVKGLRYGSIMIMADQDHDGSHIKGLIINFLHYWFPSLLRIPGFLKEFVTPIVKVGKADDTQTFFTIPEYTAWKEANDDGHGWKCKYYKGLGTSTSTEAREYFAALEDHEILFTHEGAEDDDLIDMSFNHSRADERKTWISRCQENTYVDHTQATISYNEFVNKELVLYAKYDVERMIPSVVDGFKPGQRKVLFGCFKKKLSADIKVAQLSGYVAEHSAYHHGESSLQGTIIGMAQSFVGSNNISLLVPSGQFGTRLQGGKDHAASRYIFTRLSKVTRCLFPEEDDHVLEYLHEEGVSIEPKWYCPVIPLIAANGAMGIGVGWSCSVPNYNPRELIANVRRLLRDEPMEILKPWYRGFKGSIVPVPDTGKFECCGTATKRGRTRLEVTELPVQRWTQDYKEWLLEQLPKGETSGRALITDVKEYHTENSVHFVLSVTPDKLAEAERKGLQKVFHLKSSIATTNMWLFDPNGKIKKYQSVEDITKDFAKVRLEMYGKRKAYQLRQLRIALELIDNKLRFVQLVVTETLEVDGRKSQALCVDMRKHGLQHKRDIDGVSDGEQLTLQEEIGPLGYKYLLGMKLWTLTEDRLEELKRQHAEKTAQVAKLEGTTLEELWEADLVKLEQALDAADRDDAKEAEAALKLAKKNMGAELEGLTNRQCVLVLTQDFKAKRVQTSQWKALRSGKRLNKRRGLVDGKTLKKLEEDEGEEGEEEDEADAEGECLRDVFCCYDFDALLVFTEEGQVFSVQALDVPAAKTAKSKATPLKDFVPDLGDQHVAAIVTVPQRSLKDQSDEFVVLVSRDGMAKKVSLDKFKGLERSRKGKSAGLPCFKLDSGDKLKWAIRATEHSSLIVVSQSGFANRVSLGADWQGQSTAGPGRRAMRIKCRHGKIAGCTVKELTTEEKKAAEEKKALAIQKKEEKRREREEREAAAAAEGGVMAAPAASGPGRPAKKAEADDDDSDNAAEDNAADEVEDAESDGAEGADGADSDLEKPDVDMAAADAAKAPCPSPVRTAANGAEAPATSEAGAADGEVQPAAGSAPAATPAEEISDWGTCLLMVTETGKGIRLPFTHPRLAMGRRGGVGKRVMNVPDGDDIMGACIVSGKVEARRPPEARRSIFFFLDEASTKEIVRVEVEKLNAEKENRKEVEVAKKVNTENDDAKEEDKELTADTPFLARRLGERLWAKLSESQQQVYNERAEAEKVECDKLLAAYNKENADAGQEQVMVGSKTGFISRIIVETTPVSSKKCVRGKAVVKIKGRDTLNCMSLLSAADDVDDDAAPQEAAVASQAPDVAMEAAEAEEEAAEETQAAAEAPKSPKKQQPVMIAPLRSSNSLPLPGTPPSSKKVGTNAELAAASHLGTPPQESPGRRFRGKQADPTRESIDSVARPSVTRSPNVKSPARGPIVRQSSDAKSPARGKPTAVRKSISKPAK